MRERMLAWRNRLLADPKFQRWAVRFPLTRPVARARARRLFDLTAGFVYSQTLYAWVELGLLEALKEGPREAADLAFAAQLEVDRLYTLLVAGEAIGLTERLPDGRYILGSEGAALLGNPGIAEMIAHHRHLYADLADPVVVLRGGGGKGALAAYWPYATAKEGDVAPYSALMAASQPMIAAQVLAAYDFSRHRCLLDVGGGEGAFLEAVAAEHPGLALQLFDLPDVAARAQARLGGRVAVTGGHFLTDPLPEGADIVSLIRILHDHDDSVVVELLGRLRAEMAPGATLLIAEPMAETKGAERVGAYFSLYLAAMGSGRPRNFAEISEMLRNAGFADIRHRPAPMPILASVVTARHR